MQLFRKKGLFESGRVIYVPVDQLRPNPAQPRRQFAQEGLEELAASIREHGILQPLSVRRGAEGLELVSGEAAAGVETDVNGAECRILVEKA